MNKRVDFSQLGGFPATQFMTSFMQDSYRLALAALASIVGDKVILQGVDVAGGVVSNGWISLNGELLPFVGGPLPAGATVITQETVDSRIFDDGTSKQVYFTKVAKLGSPGGFPFTDLKKLGTFGSHVEDDQNPHKVTLTQVGYDASDNPDENDSEKLATTKATKTLADRIKGVYSGVIYVGDIPAGDPVWTVNHDYNIQGNYAVFFSIKSEGANPFANNKMSMPAYYNCTPNSFDMTIQEIAGEVQNMSIAWLIIKL